MNRKLLWMGITLMLAHGGGLVSLAVNPPCTPGCHAWNCDTGSVNNPGTLSKTEEVICVGGSASLPSISGTTFHNGWKQRDCWNQWCTPYGQGNHITYTKVYRWHPENFPGTFSTCGEYPFTAYVKGVTTDTDCPAETGEEEVGTFTVKVVKVEIAPASANMLINRCEDPERSVAFCLTGGETCYPGGVTWVLNPAGVPDGATLSGSGGCATVTIGNVVTSYTITAFSNDNPDCYDSATLTVERDYDCTRHIKNDTLIPLIPAGAECGGDNLPWNGSVIESPCGHTAQIVCAWCNQANSDCSSSKTCFIFYLNGSDVGHCLYDASIISEGVFICNCGDVIMGSEWIISNTATGNGYWLVTTCGSRDGPHCFHPDGKSRPCNGGCDDY